MWKNEEQFKKDITEYIPNVIFYLSLYLWLWFVVGLFKNQFDLIQTLFWFIKVVIYPHFAIFISFVSFGFLYLILTGILLYINILLKKFEEYIQRRKTT